MTDFSDADISAYRDKLEAWRAALTGEEEKSAEWRAPVALDQQSVGRLSRIDAMQQQAMAEAEARRRRSDIARIGAALARIEEGEFGWCLSCGEAIARKRLDIDPAASQCVGCAKR